MYHLRKGFTLIELLVVIAIIGLLASVVLASLNSAREKGRDARRLADVKQIQLALELYYDENGHYPIPSNSYVSLLTSHLQPYLTPVPEDPTRTGGRRYRYWYAGNGSSYSLLIDFENDGDDNFCVISVPPGYEPWINAHGECEF